LMIYKRLLILVLTLLTCASCSSSEKDTSFREFVVKKGHIEKSIAALGVVQSKKERAIYSKIDGIFMRLNKKLGEAVESGQVIMKISSENISEDILDLEQKYLSAKEDLLNTKNKLFQKKIELDRQTILLKSRSISKSELEKTKSEYKLLEDIQEIKNSIVQQIYIQKNIMESTLDEAIVKAPISGSISDISDRDIGEPIKKGQYLFSISNEDSLVIEAFFDEVDGQGIKSGQKAIIRGDALGVKEVSGTVVLVSPKVKDSKILSYISVSNLGLKIGTTVEVEIIIGESNNATMVPIDAVSRNSSGQNILIIKDKKEYKDMPIETGIVNIEYVEITSPNIQEGLKVYSKY